MFAHVKVSYLIDVAPSQYYQNMGMEPENPLGDIDPILSQM